MTIGSCEWFKEKAKNPRKVEYQNGVELLRDSFLKNFSPKKLQAMRGAELLSRVFDSTPDTMMYLLRKDLKYMNGFGASSQYPYMSIIYKGKDGLWYFFQNNKSILLTKDDAEIKAEEIRDVILMCVDVIEKSTLNTVEDYKLLDKKLGDISYLYNYVTILKYFQMVFPYYFPCMYSDFTLNRCIQILGLKRVGQKKRIQNMGIISIFIRNCGIHTSVFGSIYADEWGWTGTKETCPASDENMGLSFRTEKSNISLFSLGAI